MPSAYQNKKADRLPLIKIQSLTISIPNSGTLIKPIYKTKNYNKKNQIRKITVLKEFFLGTISRSANSLFFIVFGSTFFRFSSIPLQMSRTHHRQNAIVMSANSESFKLIYLSRSKIKN